MGARINHQDHKGMYALKIAFFVRKDIEGTEILLKRGANLNSIDSKGRNLLHHIINRSSASADASFEDERFLIKKGINCNLKDNKGRVPLHYAFVKIGQLNINNPIDPIETVSSLIGAVKNLQIDVADKYGKTPLHYAS